MSYGFYQDCTGGIVWETAYLLATYLEHHQGDDWRRSTASPTVLELGAGCGMLGLVLARGGCDVTLTEVPVAMGNLSANTKACMGGKEGPCPGQVAAQQLRWDVPEDLEAFGGKAFDLILATDCVFSKVCTTREASILIDSYPRLVGIGRLPTSHIPKAQ